MLQLACCWWLQQQQTAAFLTTTRLAPTCGPRITIHIRGKEERGWLAEGYEEYSKRLRPTLQLNTVWHKVSRARVQSYIPIALFVICAHAHEQCRSARRERVTGRHT
jgi:hypothetical protein